MSKILDVVIAHSEMSTLVRGVNAAGLEEELNGPGPYTVFAPTNLAFGKLPAGIFEDLLQPENRGKLFDILNYHVVRGKTKAKQFSDGQKLKTVNGQTLSIAVSDGTVSINGAKIQTRDIEASNGIIHSLDTVVMPS